MKYTRNSTVLVLSSPWNETMQSADIEMRRAPPPTYLLKDKAFRVFVKDRNVHAQKDLLFRMCDSCCEFIPPIIWDYYRQYDKRHLSQGMLAVVRTIYRQLCWEGVIHDTKFARKT